MSVNKHVVVAGGVLAISLMTPMMADAASVAITSAASAQSVAVTSGAAGGYVVSDFNLNVSAHTSLAYDGNTTAVGVKAANSKGMHTFGGSSNGGSVKACETTSVATPSVSTATIATGC